MANERMQLLRKLTFLSTSVEDQVAPCALDTGRAVFGGAQDINSPKIFFNSLKKKTTRDEVQAALVQHGEILYLKLPFNIPKKKNLGYGYVIFKDPSIGHQLLESIKRIEIDGKLIELTLYTDPEKNASKKTKTKKPQSTIKTHITTQTPGKACTEPKRSPQTKNMTKASNQNQDSGQDTGTWDYHAIKPCSRLYSHHHLSHAISANQVAENLHFRIRKNLKLENQGKHGSNQMYPTLASPDAIHLLHDMLRVFT